MRISFTDCYLIWAVFISLLCNSCHPVTISPSSFEDVAEADGIDEISIKLDSWGKTFFLQAEFDSDRDTYIRPEDVVVLSGHKRRKVRLCQRNSSLPDSVQHIVKGHNVMRIFSKMTRRKSDTLSVSVRLPDEDRIWEVLRFVPANGVYGYCFNGMKAFGKDIGDEGGQFRLSVLYSSISPFWLSYDVFVEPRKGVVDSMSKQERQSWNHGIQIMLDSLRTDYDRQTFTMKGGIYHTPYYGFRSNFGDIDSLPVMTLIFERRDGRRIERTPDVSLLPCGAIMLDGGRVIDDTIRIVGGRKAVKTGGWEDKNVIVMSEKTGRLKGVNKESDTRSAVPFHLIQYGHSLSFEQPCAGCILSLLRNGVSVYESEINEFDESSIPLSFSGTYELRVTCGDAVYEAEITF